MIKNVRLNRKKTKKYVIDFIYVRYTYIFHMFKRISNYFEYSIAMNKNTKL